MQAHNTGLVFFDTILAVEGQPVQRHAGTAAAICEVYAARRSARH